MLDENSKILLNIAIGLAEVKGELKEIHAKLDNDYNIIYGRGKPGLLDRQIELEKLIEQIICSQKQLVMTQTEMKNDTIKIFSSILKLAAWIATTVIAVYGMLRK